jgi:Uma2 family endonuclease
MSAVLTPPQPATTPPPAGGLPAGPRPYRWTIDGYKRLYQAGLLDGLNTILMHGEVYVMPQPSPQHDGVVGLLENWLRGVFDTTGRHVRSQKSFDVGTDSDPGPDLAVVPGTVRDYMTQAPRTAALVVEVAVTSLAKDTTEKAELYATAGVPDYWVLDVVNRQLHVFRDPAPLPEGLGATAYRTRLTYGPADAVSPLAAAATVVVAALLP